ncbi:hypothetical protein [Candidatus Binatus sp.]|uniref:hypothetical protein n=1 Tax=Candidatus Binatus sp. TaxID=2811406 RepID=UPI003D0F9BBE
MTDMKWHRGFALHLRLLRQSVLFPPKMQLTPLLGKILDSTVPAQNGNSNQANNRNGERKRGNVGLHVILVECDTPGCASN